MDGSSCREFGSKQGGKFVSLASEEMNFNFGRLTKFVFAASQGIRDINILSSFVSQLIKNFLINLSL